jgi:amidase
MPGFAEYDSHDALGLAELVRAGQVSSAELVEECISRIERVNPQINSVVFELFEAARARSLGDLGDGPFAGVPFLIKDLIQRIPGVPTQEGSRFFKGWTPTEATNLYKRWLDAGVVPVAKTATSEMGLEVVVETELHGVTRNRARASPRVWRPWHRAETEVARSALRHRVVGCSVTSHRGPATHQVPS